METYLLVIKLASGDCYLELTPENQIAAVSDINLTIKRFDLFYDRIFSQSYETHMSAAWGILNFRPFVIKVPEGQDAEWLRQFLLDNKTHKITGGNVNIPNPMSRVDPKILEHSILDICKNLFDTLSGMDV